MLVENQKVEVKWGSSNKKWYKEKGYEFTKMGDKIFVDVEDLPYGSKARVRVICDYCGKEYECYYYAYTNGRNKFPKDACYICAGKKAQDINKDKRAEKYFKEMLDICDKNGYILLTKKRRLF